MCVASAYDTEYGAKLGPTMEDKDRCGEKHQNW